jgi:predicted permease
MLGRYFLPEDGQPSTGPVVILGYNIWTQLFNGDRDVINRTMLLDERKHTIIGVMPQGFEFPIRFRHGDYQAPKVELWIPLKEVNPEGEPRSGHYLFVLGRLKPETTFNQARADLTAIANKLEKEYPNTNREWGVRLTPLQQQYTKDIRLMLLTLFGAVSFLILIACANIANLRFSQSLSRQNEFAIRSAIGCSRWRLMRLLFMESLLLSLAGGAAGLAVAHGILRILIVIGTTDPRLLNSRLDGWVICYIFIISTATAALFGLLPAIRASKTNLINLLKVDGQTGPSVGSPSHLSKSLVVAEITLSFVLLIGAGLMLRSFINLQNVNLGFERNNITTAQIRIPSETNNGPERPVQFFKELMERISALPGVDSASMASDTPLDNENFALGFSIENRERQTGDIMTASVRTIAPNYFRTMGVRIIEGREFNESDVLSSPGVVMINEDMARRFWPEESPIGRVISIGFPAEQRLFGKAISRKIVGVVADTRDDRLETVAVSSLFVPHAQRPWTRLTVVVRSQLPVGSLAASLSNEFR